MKIKLPGVCLHGPRLVTIVLCAYTALLAALMVRTPLWLDEVLQLQGTARGSAADAIQWSGRNPGGVPLGYLAQWVSLQLFGVSAVAARIPSALAGVLSAAILYRLCRLLRVPSPSLALVLFLFLPLELRYAVEARPYALALLLSLAATEVAVRLDHQPRRLLWLLYFFFASAAIATQPYSLLPLLAHPLRLNRRFAPVLAGAIAVNLPWFAAFRAGWHDALSTAGIHAHFEPGTLLMMVRELSGAGYLGSLPLLALAVWGARSPRLPKRTQTLLVAAVAIPPVAVCVADAAFGYFFAIRQLLFILPPLVILASEGLRRVTVFHPRSGALALAGLLALFSFQTLHRLRRNSEDWAAAAATLHQAAAQGACVLVDPPEQLALYSVFYPSLQNHRCTGDLGRYTSVLLICSPYSTSSGCPTRWPAKSSPPGGGSSPFTVYLRTSMTNPSILAIDHGTVLPSRRRPCPRPIGPPAGRPIDGQCGHHQWRGPGSVE